jgi:hypothetical protein
MKICIPSKGRAGKTTTQRILPSAMFFVPESEAEDYRRFTENVVTVPMEVQGITKTRNWILDHVEDARIVFIDDDAMAVGWKEVRQRMMVDKPVKDERFWLREFELYFDLAEQMGYKIWGVKTEAASRSVYPWKPILFQTYVTASCMGLINDGEYRFDESFPVKEDYEICLRHIRDKGGLLGIRYVHWQNEHWTTAGGCKDYRTIAMEREAIIRLIKLYPGMVSTVKRVANEFTIRLNF